MLDLKTSLKKFNNNCELVVCRITDVNPGYTRQCYLELPKHMNLPKGFVSKDYIINDINRINSIIQTYWQNCWLTKDGYRYWLF